MSADAASVLGPTANSAAKAVTEAARAPAQGRRASDAAQTAAEGCCLQPSGVSVPMLRATIILRRQQSKLTPRFKLPIVNSILHCVCGH